MKAAGTYMVISLVLVLLALGASFLTSPVCAEPLPGQEGLPPELIILAEPALEDQIDDLEDLADYAEENAPEGGFVATLKNLFSSSKKPRLVNIDQLSAHVTGLKGTQVAVEGIYEAQGEDGAVFRSEGATCHLRVQRPTALSAIRAPS